MFVYICDVNFYQCKIFAETDDILVSFIVTGISSDIIQIAAAYGQNTFCRYIVPKQAITCSAAKVTGFSKSGQILYRNSEIMPTDDLLDSLKEFINWLPDNCILLGHNAKLFDSSYSLFNGE